MAAPVALASKLAESEFSWLRSTSVGMMTRNGKSIALEYWSGANKRLRRHTKESWQHIYQFLERWRYRDLWNTIQSPSETNSEIIRLLQGSSPFLVSRLGQTEARILGESLWSCSSYSRISLRQAHQNAGIFPAEPWMLDQFAAIYGDALTSVDLLGFWQTPYQARLISQCDAAIRLGLLASLEPYGQEPPWSQYLQDKTVLVVHPFVDSIREQYELKRDLIFPGRNVLPRFNLKLAKPPQTIAPCTGGFDNWVDALNSLVDQVLSLEFDVALVGCGAYGLPLGAFIKSSGRQVIHLGGSLQILFGIRGRRWDTISAIRAMINDSWVRPSLVETPSAALMVDEGCYW